MLQVIHIATPKKKSETIDFTARVNLDNLKRNILIKHNDKIRKQEGLK